MNKFKPTPKQKLVIDSIKDGYDLAKIQKELMPEWEWKRKDLTEVIGSLAVAGCFNLELTEWAMDYDKEEEGVFERMELAAGKELILTLWEIEKMSFDDAQEDLEEKEDNPWVWEPEDADGRKSFWDYHPVGVMLNEHALPSLMADSMNLENFEIISNPEKMKKYKKDLFVKAINYNGSKDFNSFIEMGAGNKNIFMALFKCLLNDVMPANPIQLMGVMDYKGTYNASFEKLCLVFGYKPLEGNSAEIIRKNLQRLGSIVSVSQDGELITLLQQAANGFDLTAVI